ncbi:MAG: germination protein YpeB [Oscillospiraceae bacterium]|nr:germination protein YpeB [Oscillospiraceae bacterium]
MLNISKRAFVRIIAFTASIITVLLIMVLTGFAEAEQVKLELRNNQNRAAAELSRSFENIKNTLLKAQYSGSHEFLNELAVRLGNDTAAAKANLAQLPLSDLNLVNTNKFLSQVGNYAKALALGGAEISAEDRENLKLLYDYAVLLTEQAWDSGGEPPPDVTDGFKELEDTFAEYPMLIYDGPFSDHIMQKEPLMLIGAGIISEEAALEKAVRISGAQGLTLLTEEDGRMASYVFADGSRTIAITKAGGHLSYMLGYRAVESERISASQATRAAKIYLEKLGVTEIIETYYETRGGVCIINFAGKQGDITLYTDLIKVAVAMDTGEILSVDKRGWLVNHNPNGREINEPLLSAEQARARVSPFLTTESARLCIIPSDGMNERLCYEFRCVSQDGRQVLVYINANTGREEQIFLLEISQNGTLVV